MKNFTPNGSPFFENEKTETLNALGVRFEETHDAIANIKEIRALKRSLSEQKYVDNIISTVSNMPFQAARKAAQDLDFDNLKDVRRYQDNAHAVIWAVVESAMHMVNVLLWGPCLIDDEDVAKIREDLYRSAEFYIKRVKAPSTAPVENEIGELAKPTCEVCWDEEAWDTLDDFRVGVKCLHEMKSIAFTRATNEEHDSGLSEKRAGALSAIISTVHDKSQAAVLSSFISLLASHSTMFFTETLCSSPRRRRIALRDYKINGVCT